MVGDEHYEALVQILRPLVDVVHLAAVLKVG
jgi:hypothetical protein